MTLFDALLAHFDFKDGGSTFPRNVGKLSHSPGNSGPLFSKAKHLKMKCSKKILGPKEG
jgi:hypothetical protein